MNVIWQALIIIAITLVVVEFGLHVIYHAMTGKGGLYDKPFAYLKEIFKF